MAQEMWALFAVYQAICQLIGAGVDDAGIPPDRISFLDTIRWLLSAAPGEELPKLLINPLRPGRHEPRVVKDFHDTYRKLTKPRKQMRRRLDLAKR